jgi:hypothetical protein
VIDIREQQLERRPVVEDGDDEMKVIHDSSIRAGEILLRAPKLELGFRGY